MRRGRIYTFLLLLLSFTVVIGGWFLTKELLRQKEAQILAKRGTVYTLSSELVYQEEEQEEAFEGTEVTEDEIVNVLTAWESGGEMSYVKDPKEDEMNMDQAISAGKEWMDRLMEAGLLPDVSDQGYYRLAATMHALYNSAVNARAGFWRVSYEYSAMTVDLSIHASSGQVWQAFINIHEDGTREEWTPRLELFYLMAPYLEDMQTNYAVLNNGYRVFDRREDGKIWAYLYIYDNVYDNNQADQTDQVKRESSVSDTFHISLMLKPDWDRIASQSK